MPTEAKPTPTDDSDSSSSSEDGSVDAEEVQVESLVAGRSRRSTAGNRLSSLIEKEGDDELELLFAEAEGEEDVEFAGDDGEDASDVQLDSSSDDDDQGPSATAADDLEGEKELQKQDRQERRKKRKAQEVFKRPPAVRHKVKFDPTTTSTAPATPLARPSKKSGRVSWLPTPDEGPTRSSSRKQTVQNKEVVHQRMQEHEKRRRQQIEVMEAAAKRKEASKPKAMTQADRLAEAARTEKKNAKSLNRWEESEKKRAEDQKARLTALRNRQLKGPVITWWSGPAKWVDDKLVKVGKEKVPEIPINPPVTQIAKDHTSDVVPPSTIKEFNHVDPDITMDDAPISASQVPVPRPSSGSQNHPLSLPSLVYSAPPRKESFSPNHVCYESKPQHESQDGLENTTHISERAEKSRPLPQSQPVIEYSTCNFLILENVDANAMRTPELQNHVLLQKPKKAATRTPSTMNIKASVASG